MGRNVYSGPFYLKLKTNNMFDFNKKFTKRTLQEFADLLIEMNETIGFKVSSRGWCYLMEQAGHINKSQFDKVGDAVNRCRVEGLIPVDFVAEEDARAFAGVENPDNDSMLTLLQRRLDYVIDGWRFYTPDWWDGEDYYIQMVVEKIDLKTLFEPICAQYHIPVANAKGWSSILQRAEYARRFKEAEERGLKCVLLYCGDHDPDGLRISDTLRNNLEQVRDVRWEDGADGYDPSDLEIVRFGLNYNFIIANRYTWIDNLITGSGKNLASPQHKNYRLTYVQDYLKKIGARKCEANAIVTTPRKAQDLVRGEIEKWLGVNARQRFKEKEDKVKNSYVSLLDRTGLREPIENVIESQEGDFDE
jgi:hypothetical protein